MWKPGAAAMPETGYRGRFAPSPTGPLHLGSLVAALISWLRARQQRGRWLLRVEDIDPLRERPGVAKQQIEALARFGMEPDEPIIWQSHRSDHYANALRQLQEAGLAYPCACSRSDLEPFAGKHPDRCVASDPSRQPAWRARTERYDIRFEDLLQGTRSGILEPGDDFVLQRVEGFYAYPLAVVVDDADAGVTEVVRGADLLDATPRQIWLQRKLGLNTPAYAHLPLVTDEQGNKLSKSLAALPVDSDDPIPALRVALGWLGIELARERRPDRILLDCIDRFDWDSLREIDHWNVASS